MGAWGPDNEKEKEEKGTWDLDQHFMRQAIAAAEEGRFTAPPNPWVGCVIVAGEWFVVYYCGGVWFVVYYCGGVWCGVVWCGVVWCGVVWQWLWWGAVVLTSLPIRWRGIPTSDRQRISC